MLMKMMKRGMAWLLCLLLCVSLIPVQSFASALPEGSEETQETEAAVTETAETETVQASESEMLSETEAMVLSVEETTETEAAETETEKETDLAEPPVLITAFEALPEDQQVLYLSYEDKPSEEDLQAYLPAGLKAAAADGTEQIVDVHWQVPEEYAETGYFLYLLQPVWDDQKFSVAEDVQLPAVWLRLTRNLLMTGTPAANEAAIFKFVTQTMKLNVAAACGILANIEAESDFDPGLEEDTYSSNKGYGICQWSFDRRRSLESYLTSHGYAHDSLQGQLEYMYKELQGDYKTSVLDKLKAVANTSDGAYDAGYIWCYNFEVPASYWNVSKTRGYWAEQNYWPKYSGEDYVGTDEITISSQTVPSTLTVGDSFSIRGSVRAGTNLKKVTVGVYNMSGTMKIGKTVTPNMTTYSLSNVDTSIKFGTLAAGVYRYKVDAEDAGVSETLINKVFIVLGNSRTVADGTYNIVLRNNSGYGLNAAGASKASGANIELHSISGAGAFARFKVTYQSGGYYRIQNVGSGQYLGVAGQSSKNDANVEQSSSGTLWQILPDSKGGYELVPKCSTACVADVKSAKVADGTNIQSHIANLTDAESWQLKAAAAAGALPAISGQTLPGTLKTGQSFTVRGNITSDTRLTEVAAGVYNMSGTRVAGKTVNPNALTCDLYSQLDSSIKFGTLSPGVYRYQVTASNDAGSKTLVNKVFIVLGATRTVADGTYNIVLKNHTGYGLNAAGSSKASGANIELRSISSSNAFAKFKVTYQSDGWYKIQNVGSGQYLGVAGQSKANDANVEQSSAGTLWQILKDSRGGYEIVSRCATDCVLDVKSAKIADGTNIQNHRANMTDAETWSLAGVTAYSEAAISGQTTPGTLNAGSSFTVRGNITSDTALTEVAAGVYNMSGTRLIGKTANPKTTSYDLYAQMDSSMKFGTLGAGVYRYQVTATNSAGKKTLVNKVFIVLGNARTVADGTYNIVLKNHTGYGLNAAGSSKASGANIELRSINSGNQFEKWTVTYQSDGWYRIRNAGSGQYLGVAGQSSKNDANVEQSSAGTLWQILKDSTGGYEIVSRSATDCVLDVKSAKIADGTNIQNHRANMTDAETWSMVSVPLYNAPTISGQTAPGTLYVDYPFTLRGRISSQTALTEVTAGVYNMSGTRVIGRTANPKTTSYDLYTQMDSSIKFGTLSAGVYRYQVTATNSGGKKTLVNKVFIVLADSRTVADGTYNIVLKNHTGYGLNVAGSSKASGANIELRSINSSNACEKFRITYQGNGWYSIQNVGSGRYLGVAGQSANNDANVEQSSSGTLWQILKDSKGGYEIVSQCATDCVLDVKSAKIADGTNIQNHRANMTDAEMWQLIAR